MILHDLKIIITKITPYFGFTVTILTLDRRFLVHLKRDLCSASDQVHSVPLVIVKSVSSVYNLQ